MKKLEIEKTEVGVDYAVEGTDRTIVQDEPDGTAVRSLPNPLVLVDEINELAHQWERLKEQEEQAHKERSEIEEQIVKMQEKRDEGTVARKTQYYKITTTYKLNRKLDIDDWEKIKNTIPARFHPVRCKTELDLRAYHELESNNQEYFLTVAKCIDAKPAKPQIKIEKIK